MKVYFERNWLQHTLYTYYGKQDKSVVYPSHAFATVTRGG